MMYFIFDANGVLFGNPKGYAKHSIAQRICTRYRYKLWDIYDNRTQKDSNLIYEIKLHSIE